MGDDSWDEDSWTDDEDEDEPEAWDDDGMEDDETLIPCPYCRREIPEDSPRCPYCENYILAEDLVPNHKPWWIIVGALLAGYAVYRWITLGY
jgi:hypothetical protein